MFVHNIGVRDPAWNRFPLIIWKFKSLNSLRLLRHFRCDSRVTVVDFFMLLLEEIEPRRYIFLMTHCFFFFILFENIFYSCQKRLRKCFAFDLFLFFEPSEPKVYIERTGSIYQSLLIIPFKYAKLTWDPIKALLVSCGNHFRPNPRVLSLSVFEAVHQLQPMNIKILMDSLHAPLSTPGIQDITCLAAT